MKFLASALVGALIFATTAPGFAQGSRITTEAEFRKAVVGKRLFLGDNWFIVQKNGKLRGNFGDPVRGAWEWRSGFWCRTLTKPRQNTDCQTWDIVPGGFKATRDQGKGRSFVYTVK